MRALVAGAIAALVVIALVVVAVLTGALPFVAQQEGPQRVLVIATSADDEGTEVARFAFVLEPGVETALLLDTEREITVEGTTARSASEAYPFGGSRSVAKALAGQTGGEELEWIMLPPQTWAELVDAAGGVEATIPRGLSSYRDGRLTVLEAGERKLRGDDMVALASALEFVEPQAARRELAAQLSAGLSAVVASNSTSFPSLVSEGAAESSLSAKELAGFSAKP